MAEVTLLPRPLALVLALLVVVGSAGCASSRRVAALETRLAAAEQARAEDRAAIDTALARLAHAVRAIERATALLDGPGSRDVEMKLEELMKQIAELEQKVGKAPPTRRRPEPDPADVYAIPATGAPSEGPADALVTIVRAYEYACPYCEKSRKTLAELRRRYPDELRIVYRPFIVHPQTATLPAQAACAAERQGQFAAYDVLLWDKAFATRQFDQTYLEQLAVEAGLDLDRFRADLTGPCVAEVQASQAELQQFGVGATPNHFINGRYLPGGAVPVEQFAAVIDDELAKAKERIARVAKKKRKQARARYYQTWVIDQGKPRFDPAAVNP